MLRSRINIIAAILILTAGSVSAQSFTFAVDDVVPASESLYGRIDGKELASNMNRDPKRHYLPQEVLVSSFSEETNLHSIGRDALYKMLRVAWCQHRPVVLTPDAVWMVISQGLSYHVNQYPEQMRRRLVNHDGKMKLTVATTDDLLSDYAAWEKTISEFSAQIAKYSAKGISQSLVADFSTTGSVERIASEITQMDVVKPYFNYESVYVICGIPSVTLTGTPDDWRKVLEKSRSLKKLGLGWWQKDLEPILKQFISASEGNPDIAFWKNMVMTTRPDKIQGPVCAGTQPELTKFNGWFLKLFPFDEKGRTPSEVNILHSTLLETVRVPFKYNIMDASGNTLESHELEIVAGIVGVEEDPQTFALTPKIGWIVRKAVASK